MVGNTDTQRGAVRSWVGLVGSNRSNSSNTINAMSISSVFLLWLDFVHLIIVNAMWLIRFSPQNNLKLTLKRIYGTYQTPEHDFKIHHK